jgi:hypothetical protein
MLVDQQLGGTPDAEGAGETSLPSAPYGGPNHYGFPL